YLHFVARDYVDRLAIPGDWPAVPGEERRDGHFFRQLQFLYIHARTAISAAVDCKVFAPIRYWHGAVRRTSHRVSGLGRLTVSWNAKFSRRAQRLRSGPALFGR